MDEKKDYISYLEQMIKQEEEALENCRKFNDEKVEAAIKRRLDSYKADLEKAKKL